MQTNVLVVDDFYTDPDSVRQLAKNDTRWLSGENPGHGPLDRVTLRSYYNTAVVETFEALLNRKIEVDPARHEFGVFTLFLADVDVVPTVHYDDTPWSALVYLVPDELCQGGLGLFRHRATGLRGRPTPEQVEAMGFASVEDWERDVYYPDKSNPDAWEQTDMISMRYNRLVLLRGIDNFHRPTASFGTDINDGRLVQRFFFDDAEAS